MTPGGGSEGGGVLGTLVSCRLSVPLHYSPSEVRTGGIGPGLAQAPISSGDPGSGTASLSPPPHPITAGDAENFGLSWYSSQSPWL